MARESQRAWVPAVEGWFRMDGDEPRLLGTRCLGCGSTFFPKETAFCRNPACAGSEFESVELSRRGTLWSFTDNRYEPPAPYVASKPFEPYAIAAVELAARGWPAPTTAGWLGLGYLALFASAACYTLYNFALRELDGVDEVLLQGKG